MISKNKKYNFKKTKPSDQNFWCGGKIISLIVLFTFLVLTVLFIHPFGKPKAVKMDDYFIKNAQLQTGSNNVVSSIVFDYRGLDTLGESTVLFAAVMGISLILIKKRHLYDQNS